MKQKLRDYITYTSVLLVLTVMLGLWVYYSAARPSSRHIFGLLGDAFSLSGFLGLLGGLFIYVSNEGLFDIISYGVKRVFRASFDVSYRENMPQTFLAYKQAMKDKRRPMSGPFFLVAAIFLLIGAAFIGLFYIFPNL